MQNIYGHVDYCENNIFTWHYYHAFTKIGVRPKQRNLERIPSGVYGDDHIGLYLGLASVYMPLGI